VLAGSLARCAGAVERLAAALVRVPQGHRGGETYDPAEDYERLNRQADAVFRLMQDGRWRSLAEIAAVTGHPPASISARLRDFRKRRFGGHIVERRCEGNGLYRYLLRPNVNHAGR
jgi:hypothetical protein